VSTVPVPNLATSSTGPLLELERRILDSLPAIERWFRMQWQEHTPPFYGSVDLRNAGFKLAPVDMNLYPGGWNNLSEEMLPCAVQAAQIAIEKICPDARNLLLIPERHTRNVSYLLNVARLASVLRTTGLDVRIGSLSAEIATPTVTSLPGGDSLTIEPLVRSGPRLGLAGFDPCAILLNNDLSAGIPEILRGLDQQVLLPPLHARASEAGRGARPLSPDSGGRKGQGLRAAQEIRCGGGEKRGRGAAHPALPPTGSGEIGGPAWTRTRLGGLAQPLRRRSATGPMRGIAWRPCPALIRSVKASVRANESCVRRWRAGNPA